MIQDDPIQDELNEMVAAERAQIRADTVDALNELIHAAQSFGFSPASRERDIITEARVLLEAVKRFLEAGERMVPGESNTRNREGDEKNVEIDNE